MKRQARRSGCRTCRGAGGVARGGGPGGQAVNIRGAKAAIGLVLAPTAAEQALVQAQDALQKADRCGAAGAGPGAGSRTRRCAGRAWRSARPRLHEPCSAWTRRCRRRSRSTKRCSRRCSLTRRSSSPICRAKAQRGEPLSPFSLPAAVTITIDNTFEVVSEQLTRNVVGMVEGTDPTLKDTYVLFGAHLDHIGYSQSGTGVAADADGCRQRSDAGAGRRDARPARRCRTPGARRRGGRRPVHGGRRPRSPPRRRYRRSTSATSSTTAPTMTGRDRRRCWRSPRRSRQGRSRSGRSSSSGTRAKKRGCTGSRFNADFPIVPLDRVQALLNMDMVGRDDCDNLEGDYTQHGVRRRRRSHQHRPAQPDRRDRTGRRRSR